MMTMVAIYIHEINIVPIFFSLSNMRYTHCHCFFQEIIFLENLWVPHDIIGNQSYQR